MHACIDYTRVRYVKVRNNNQATIYSLWKERNDRRHGATPITAVTLARMVDRQVRDRCLAFRQQGNFKLATGLSLWFATR